VAIKETARQLAAAERAIVLFGQGITRQPGGHGAVSALADLALLTGLYTKPGSGLNPLCEAANETGVVEMGAAPEYLPGLIEAGDAAGRRHFRELWKEEVPATAGWTVMEMLEQARRGRLKALYLVGEDPLGMLPAAAGVREALGSLELLVCQDLFLTETAKLAGIVLPSSSFAEKEGSMTNQEGCVQRIRRALEPVGESLPDWEIFTQLAGALGVPLEYASASEISDEITRAVPSFKIARAASGPPETGRPDPEQIQRYLAGVEEAELRARYQCDPAPAAAGGQSVVVTGAAMTLEIGQSLFHSGTFSRHAAELQKLEPEGRLQLNPIDAERLGVEDGDLVRISLVVGGAGGAEAVVPIVRRAKIPPGLCRFPVHFPEAGVRDLADWSVDPVTGAPYFRSGRVRVERVDALPAPAGRARAAHKGEA
jgi:formate dehydrogenase alpha subunit